ncbi:MAG: RNA-binding cell elongation regulator Jag/EloR [Eubacteriaceae bacterium]|jgi:spoIIIJ-associated protein
MNKTATGTGKTVDEATNNALAQLGILKEAADITIIQQPESGVFGLFGKKEAIVEAVKKNTAEDAARAFLEDIFEAMEIPCELEISETETDEGHFLNVNLVGENMGILIGRRGQTLDSIQYLTSLVVNRNTEEYTRVIIDTENYREKRKKTLEALADKMASKVGRYKKRISLEPMNPAERRIIHSRLQDNDNVITFSEGNDPYRHVVIQLNK